MSGGEGWGEVGVSFLSLASHGTILARTPRPVHRTMWRVAN